MGANPRRRRGARTSSRPTGRSDPPQVLNTRRSCDARTTPVRRADDREPRCGSGSPEPGAPRAPRHLRQRQRYRCPVTSRGAIGSDAPYDVCVVVTGHREGILAHRTLRSLARAAQIAQAAGVGVEVVCVLDRADIETTETFREAVSTDGTVASVVP